MSFLVIIIINILVLNVISIKNPFFGDSNAENDAIREMNYNRYGKRSYPKDLIGYRKLDIIRSKIERPIAILGAPFNLGQERVGTEKAPQFIRNEGLIKEIKRLGYTQVNDYGDLKFKMNPKDKTIPIYNNFTLIQNPFTVGDANIRIQNKVEEILSKDETLIVLGGDHSLTAGSIVGNANVNPNICVIYIDAHADINSCETTKSGHIHGMPMSFVLKELPKSQRRRCRGLRRITPVLSAKNLGYLSLRDLDDLEMNIINDLKIAHFTMEEIDLIGIRAAVHRLLKMVCKPNSAIHVSYDVDSIESVYTPHTGTPVSGGLTFREALQIAEIIASTKRMTVLEIYEVNPELEPKHEANTTVNHAINLILSFLGKSREALYAQPLGNEHQRLVNN